MSNQGLPSEFELIARYFAPLACALPGAYGLLDDAAVISPASCGPQILSHGPTGAREYSWCRPPRIDLAQIM